MKALSLLVCTFLITTGYLVHADEGQLAIPKVCYDTLESKQFCTTDGIGKVQVFVFNAGWCPPCNSEMAALAEAYSEFANQPVIFASLSGEGYSRGSKPDAAFLKSWKQKHSIPFVVAGKYRDFGTSFGANGSIPFTAITDKQGTLIKNGNLDSEEILTEVRRLLAID